MYQKLNLNCFHLTQVNILLSTTLLTVNIEKGHGNNCCSTYRLSMALCYLVTYFLKKFPIIAPVLKIHSMFR